MRQLIVKYQGECAACSQPLNIGDQAMYEKTTGIFCVGCEPKDVEDIRSFRLVKAEKKAERLDEWAEKREVKSEAVLNSNPTIRRDWAFNTQPGRIPFRDRMNRADDRAMESLNVAAGMRAKANSLRRVVVAGDAERKRQSTRDARDKIIQKGSRVYDFSLGAGEVVQICKKSYRIKFDRSGYTRAVDKSFVHPTNKPKGDQGRA